MLILAVASPINLEFDKFFYSSFSRIVFILFLFSAYLVYNTFYVYSLLDGIGIYGGVFAVSILSHVFDIILLLTGSFVTFLSCHVPFSLYNKSNLFDFSIFSVHSNEPFFSVNYIKEYSILLIFTIIGASLLIAARNLISIYLALELQSFSLYIIATSRIESFKSTSGGLKYFLLGGLSSGFILFGFSLLYAYTGTLSLDSLFMIYFGFNNFYIDVCLLFIFGGLLFKVSAAPFHNWAPDVYSDVPTISTTWLIVIAKLSILVLILTLVHNINFDLSLSLNTNAIPDIYFIFSNTGFFNSHLGLWTNIITLSACLSLVIGTIVGLNQGLTKRLLAFSTISHVGFLLAALSINTVASFDAFLFYLIQYTFTNINIFFILISWGYLFTFYYLKNRQGESIEWLFSPVPAIAQLKGMHFSDPFLAFSLAISIFSLAGIPPLIGFFAKQQVLLASMQVDYFFLSFLIINTSVIGAAYYLRIIKFIYFYDIVYNYITFIDSDNHYEVILSSNYLSLIIALFTNFILFYIFKPYLLIDLMHLITISIYI
jgi:NADH-ubiquinone oxidoreductase chain 2